MFRKKEEKICRIKIFVNFVKENTEITIRIKKLIVL